MANPCLTFLLVYAGITLIGLIITSALLATAHTTVVCEGDGEVVEVNHYSVADFSSDEVAEGTENDCKCHCDCGGEKIITVALIFILIAVGIFPLSLTAYTCGLLHFHNRKHKKKVEENARQADLKLKEEKK